MQVRIDKAEDKVLAVLQGRLDTATAPQFANDIAPLLEESDKTIILDLGALEYISSSGLRLLLNLRKATMAGGGSVVIRNASEAIMQIFAITGFTSLFRFE